METNHRKKYQIIKKAKLAPQSLRILKDIVTARAEFKKGKSTSQKIDNARKNAAILINDLIEYNQRFELMNNKEKKND